MRHVIARSCDNQQQSAVFAIRDLVGAAGQGAGEVPRTVSLIVEVKVSLDDQGLLETVVIVGRKPRPGSNSIQRSNSASGCVFKELFDRDTFEHLTPLTFISAHRDK